MTPDDPECLTLRLEGPVSQHTPILVSRSAGLRVGQGKRI